MSEKDIYDIDIQEHLEELNNDQLSMTQQNCQHNKPVVEQDEHGYWVECFDCGEVLSQEYSMSNAPYAFIDGYYKARGRSE